AREDSGGEVERRRAREGGGDEEQEDDHGERSELRWWPRIEANGLERAGGRGPLRREVERARCCGHARGQREMRAPPHSQRRHGPSVRKRETPRRPASAPARRAARPPPGLRSAC